MKSTVRAGKKTGEITDEKGLSESFSLSGNFEYRYHRDREELYKTLSVELNASIHSVIFHLSLMEEAFESGNSEKAKDCGRSAQDQLHTCESVVSALLKYLQQNSKPEPFSVCMLSELLAEFSSERICSQADPELINRDYKIRLSPFRNCLGIVIGNLDPNKDITIQGSLAGEGILQIRIFHTQDAASLKEKECWPLGILNAGGEKGIWKKGLAVARNICEQNGGRLGTGKTKAKTHFICIHWPVERVYA